MKRILLVTCDFPPMHGGVGKYYAELFRQMTDGEVVILAERCKDGRDFDATYPHPVVRRHFFTPKPSLLPRWLLLFWHLEFAIRRYHTERICVGQALPMGHVVRLIAKLHGIPYYVFVHGMDIAQKNKRRREAALRRILCGARGVIANSAFTRGLLARYDVPESRSFVLMPCPAITPDVLWHEDQYVAFVKEKFKDKRIVLFVGRLVRRKGVDLLLDALARLRYGKVTLLILGGGPEEQALEERIRQQGLSGNAVVLGELPDRLVAAFYEASEIVVLPSREIEGDVEGFGMVCLEGSSFGKPVIASRTGGVSEAVVHSVTGIVVTPERVDELTSALKTLLDDSDLRTRLGTAGRDRIEQEFKWSDRAAKLQQFFASHEEKAI